MHVYNINIRKLHFQANICEVLAEDKKQHYYEDLDVGWADLLFMKSSRTITLNVCRQAIPLISRSVNLIVYQSGIFFQLSQFFGSKLE